MILRYNWPLYVAGLSTAVAGIVVAGARGRHPLVRITAGMAGAVAGWLAGASLAASWWVYDHSELYRWTWLRRAVPVQPGSVLVVHAGLDEASEPVRRVWPAAAVETADVHRGVGRTTASLRRARANSANTPTEQPESEVDAVVAFLAAHEIRTRGGRLRLIATIANRLRPGGRLVVVEHVRDLANALAYGPAISHFYPAGEWRRAIAAADLELVAEERLTPFVVLLIAENRR